MPITATFILFHVSLILYFCYPCQKQWENTYLTEVNKCLHLCRRHAAASFPPRSADYYNQPLSLQGRSRRSTHKTRIWRTRLHSRRFAALEWTPSDIKKISTLTTSRNILKHFYFIHIIVLSFSIVLF